MNCGKDLQVEVVERVTEPKVEPEVLSPTVTQPPGPSVQQPAAQPVEQQLAEDVTEERKLIEQLSKLYNWSLKLINLLLEKEASSDVFVEIYEEYSTRLNNINERRLELLQRYEQRLRELTEKVENLKVRHEVGEVGDREYIRQKIELDREITKLRPKIGILQNPVEIRLADIADFTENLKRLMEDVKSKGPQLGISQQLTSKIVSDLENLLKATDVMREMHKKIKHEIAKLELRFKIGELKQDEYLAQRQRLERQLELVF